MKYNTTQKKETQFNLPNTIKNITFYFIKQHYNKYLEEKELEKIPKAAWKLLEMKRRKKKKK